MELQHGQQNSDKRFAFSSVEQMDRWGREALESMLTLVAYIAFAEHCTVGGAKGNVFKAFRQRSAGPLWAMFKKCAASTGQKWQIVPELKELALVDIAGDIDKAVSVALSKHGKKAADLDYSRLLQRIGNLISRALSGKAFGYFEDTQRPRFSMNLFKGIFRNARGPSATFIDVYDYEGPENFPSEFVFLFDVEKGRGMRLFPLIARGLDSGRSYHSETDFFVYDIVRRNDTEIAFRAVQEREEVVSNSTGDFSELFETVSAYLSEDPATGLIENIALKQRAIET